MAFVICFVLALTLHSHLSSGECPENCEVGQICNTTDFGCSKCERAYYGRKCQHRMECHYTANGEEYRGLRNTTVGGRTCQRWDSKTPQTHNLKSLELVENYCRNPDGEPGPWCFTTDPAKRWEVCGVPMCSTQCLSPPLDVPGVDIINPPSDGFAVGINATIDCMTGYENSGSPVTVTCQSDKDWTQSSLPTCSIQCLSPSLSNNSIVSNPNPPYEYGEQIIITCNIGYTLQGQNKLTCQADKFWSYPVPTCIINECDPPKPNPYSRILNNGTFQYGDVVIFVCETGYIMQGSSQLTCQANKTWDIEPPICKKINCIKLKLSANLLISNPKEQEYSYMDKISFTCEEGYKLSHNDELECQANRLWDKEQPFCIEICNGLSTPQWLGITVGLNFATALVSILVTVVIMRRFTPRDKTNDTRSALEMNKTNEAPTYDSIDTKTREESHIYNQTE